MWCTLKSGNETKKKTCTTVISAKMTPLAWIAGEGNHISIQHSGAMLKVPGGAHRIRTYRQCPTYGTTLRVDVEFRRELLKGRLSFNPCLAPHDPL